MDEQFLAALPAGPFTLIACTEVRADEGKTPQDWLDVWGVRAVDARDFEPETSAYAGCLPLEGNPKAVMVFERYTKGRQALDDHMRRQAHRTFVKTSLRNRLAKRMQIVGLACKDTYGFTRPDRPPVGEGANGPVLLLEVGRFATEALRDEYIRLSNDHCKHRWEKEPGCLTCYGGIVTADCPRGPKARKGDVLFVREFTSEEAMRGYDADPAHQRFARQVSDRGIARETIFAAAYRVTPTGFMTKPAHAGWHGAGPDGKRVAKL